MKTNVIKGFVMVLLLLCSFATRAEVTFFEDLSDSREYSKFFNSLESKNLNLVNADKTVKTSGFCAAVFHYAVNTKKLFKPKAVDLMQYCGAVVQISYLTDQVKANSFGEGVFRGGLVKGPTLAEFKQMGGKVNAVVVTQPKPAGVTATQVTSEQAKPAPVAAKAPKMIDYSSIISELKVKFDGLEKKSKDGDEKVAKDLKAAINKLSSMEDGLQKLQSGELTPEMEKVYSEKLETEMAKFKEKLSSLGEAVSVNMGQISVLKADVEALKSQNVTQANKDSAQDAKISASTPFGYSTIEYFFGTEAANEHSGILLACLVGILACITLIIYPFIFATRFSLEKVKTASDKKASDAVETADEAKTMATEAVHIAGSGVEFDAENISIEALSLLANDPNWISSGNAKQWICWYGNEQFIVKIWRDTKTPAGLVQTNIVRNSSSQQSSDPMSLKKLRSNIVNAITDPNGCRLQPVKKVKAA